MAGRQIWSFSETQALTKELLNQGRLFAPTGEIDIGPFANNKVKRTQTCIYFTIVIQLFNSIFVVFVKPIPDPNKEKNYNIAGEPSNVVQIYDIGSTIVGKAQ